MDDEIHYFWLQGIHCMPLLSKHEICMCTWREAIILKLNHIYAKRRKKTKLAMNNANNGNCNFINKHSQNNQGIMILNMNLSCYSQHLPFMIPIFSSTCLPPSPSKLDISSKYLVCLDFITLRYICVCIERNLCEHHLQESLSFGKNELSNICKRTKQNIPFLW